MQSLLGKLMMQNKELIQPSAYGLNYATNQTISSRSESMVNNQFCSDITFVVGPSKQRIYAHKYCLVTASEYFYTLFSGSFVEAQQKEVVLEDTDPEIFLLILQVIYGVKVDINDDNIREMFDCMQRFMLTDFTQPLSDFLTNQIVDQTTAMAIFKQNDYYNLKLVHEKSMHYIRNNPLYYFAQESFTSLGIDRLAKVLTAQQINCTNDQLNDALVSWEKANPNTNTKELWKLVTENSRNFYCHKLPLLGQMHVENQQCGEALSLKLESSKPLSLYGLGLYVKSKSKLVSIDITIYFTRYDSTRSLYRFASFTISNKSINALQIVDLMFEEISLSPNQQYDLSIRIKTACDKYIVLSQPYFLHDKIRIKFPGHTKEKKTVPIAYLWSKYPDCEMKGTQGTAKCCYWW